MRKQKSSSLSCAGLLPSSKGALHHERNDSRKQMSARRLLSRLNCRWKTSRDSNGSATQKMSFSACAGAQLGAQSGRAARSVLERHHRAINLGALKTPSSRSETPSHSIATAQAKRSP